MIMRPASYHFTIPDKEDFNSLSKQTHMLCIVSNKQYMDQKNSHAVSSVKQPVSEPKQIHVLPI